MEEFSQSNTMAVFSCMQVGLRQNAARKMEQVGASPSIVFCSLSARFPGNVSPGMVVQMKAPPMQLASVVFLDRKLEELLVRCRATASKAGLCPCGGKKVLLLLTQDRASYFY
jgi:hypothetical protein